MEYTTGTLPETITGWTTLEETDVGCAPFLFLVQKPQDARWKGEVRNRDRDPMDDWLQCIADVSTAEVEGWSEEGDERAQEMLSGKRPCAPPTSSSPVLAPTTTATLQAATNTDISNMPCLASSAPRPWPQTSHNLSAQAACLHESVHEGHKFRSYAWPFPHLACETDDSSCVPLQVANINPSTKLSQLPNLQTPKNLFVQTATLPVFDLSGTLPLFDMSIESEMDSSTGNIPDASIPIGLYQTSTEPEPSVSPFQDQSAAIKLKQAFQCRKNHSPRATGVLQVCEFNDINGMDLCLSHLAFPEINNDPTWDGFTYLK